MERATLDENLPDLQTGSDATEPELRMRVQMALAQSGYYALRRISCDLEDATLRLRGCVPSYFMKQVAQTIAFNIVESQLRIENTLDVTRDAD